MINTINIFCVYCGKSHSGSALVRACAVEHSFQANFAKKVYSRATWQGWISKIGIQLGETRRYAVREETGTSVYEAKLYELHSRADNGFVHVNRVTSHGGTAIDIPKTDHAAILRTISEDPAGAGELYGLITRHCSKCGKFLKRPASVQTGYGPDCYQLIYGRKQPKADES